MSLTPEQLLALKTAALADPIADGYINVGDDIALRDWFNAVTTWVIYRKTLTPQMSRSAIVQAATQLDALTPSKRDSLLWLVSETLDPTDANVRAALDDMCGSQAQLKAAIVAAYKRFATRAEKILSTGTGTTASPATSAIDGLLSVTQASDVRVA